MNETIIEYDINYEVMWICNSHYTNRQDETLVKEITYKKYET